MIITAVTITMMEIPPFTAMIMAHKVNIPFQYMSILIITMTTTISIIMRGTISATAITDTAILICPPALTERR